VQKLIAVSVLGIDKPGIIYEISEVLARNSVNIVDIEQTVLQGLFAMFIVGDVGNCAIPIEELEKQLKEKGNEIGVEVHVSPFERQESAEKRLYVLTVLGKDRVGIVYGITKILYEHGINIERTSLTARDSLISIEFVIDIKESDPEEVKRKLKEEVEKFGLDVVIQPYSFFQRDKRLIVFDMDSTIVDAEIIDELAKAAGVEDEESHERRDRLQGSFEGES
jgi:phosphoserine phosphatase